MTKYTIKRSNDFKKDLKKIIKQRKDISKIVYVIEKLANGIKLEEKYKDHILYDSKDYKGCRECHIEPDWLVIYKIFDNDMILLLVSTGSHSELF